MAYKLGLRILALLCFLSVILSPLGVFFYIKARKEEKRIEQHRENVADS